MLSQACFETVGMALEELDIKRPTLANLIRVKVPIAGERQIIPEDQESWF